jgi:hypothetical protein
MEEGGKRLKERGRGFYVKGTEGGVDSLRTSQIGAKPGTAGLSIGPLLRIYLV